MSEFNPTNTAIECSKFRKIPQILELIGWAKLKDLKEQIIRPATNLIDKSALYSKTKFDAYIIATMLKERKKERNKEVY